MNEASFRDLTFERLCLDVGPLGGSGWADPGPVALAGPSAPGTNSVHSATPFGSHRGLIICFRFTFSFCLFALPGWAISHVFSLYFSSFFLSYCYILELLFSLPFGGFLVL